MDKLIATRVRSSIRLGSSRPVVVDTRVGRRLVKLRGAAQGTGPLVAEVIVAALAEALDLRVPARSVVTLESTTPTDDRNDELADLLAASVGENLGFVFLDTAREIQPDDLARLNPAETAAILWLDALVLNPDRTARNPNLLLDGGRLYLIDHGASLRFHYDWPAVTEAATRRSADSRTPHLFQSAARSEDWPTWDALFAARLTRAVLEAAVNDVPDSFLLPMLPETLSEETPEIRTEAVRRRRAAYVAFLWKRLQPPRLSITDGQP